MLAALIIPALPAAAGAGELSGRTFQDMNRNGQYDAGETAFTGHRDYLYDAANNYVGAATSDDLGVYRFADLAAGEYRVQYVSTSWWPIREEWVPTTTHSAVPRVHVTVSGPTVQDFGWRPIIRSTTLGSPITAYRGPGGLRVESYNDVVSAQEIHDVLVQGLVGDGRAGR